LLLVLLGNGLGASGWLLAAVGILRPARPLLADAVQKGRGGLASEVALGFDSAERDPRLDAFG